MYCFWDHRWLLLFLIGARFGFILDEELKLAASCGDVRAALADKISRERIGHEVCSFSCMPLIWVVNTWFCGHKVSGKNLKLIIFCLIFLCKLILWSLAMNQLKQWPASVICYYFRLSSVFLLMWSLPYLRNALGLLFLNLIYLSVWRFHNLANQNDLFWSKIYYI